RDVRGRAAGPRAPPDRRYGLRAPRRRDHRHRCRHAWLPPAAARRDPRAGPLAVGDHALRGHSRPSRPPGRRRRRRRPVASSRPRPRRSPERGHDRASPRPTSRGRHGTDRSWRGALRPPAPARPGDHRPARPRRAVELTVRRAADALTGFRALCGLVLPFRPSVALLLVGVVTDWLDGPLARRASATAMGARFDLEADSLLTLGAAIAAVRRGLPRVGLLAPIVRYAIAPARAGDETR